ncbi:MULTISPECIES: LysE family translocator [Salinicola]|uniref:LysE family translocator n=1 Tax=Salinicola TaxID=404432 RepID=UPI0008DCC94E|nr:MULTISPECIES: LysE family translocator [Salinicola]MDF3918766.1 LysE family translocator [Salinicola salarius]OHY98679.1 threonine transporter [Salinicola sp. MIT1003]
MTFESAVTYLLAIFLFAITPGPGVFALIATGMNAGFRRCLSLTVGMTLSDVLYLLLATFGLATLAEHWGEVFGVIRVLGALYLFYLGWKLWTSPTQDDEMPAAGASGGALAGMMQGFLISASNPKVILFYIAFLPTFVDLDRLGGSSLTLLVALTVVGLMGGLCLVAAGAARARRIFRSSHAQRRLNRGAGSLMIGAGALLIAKS